MPRKKVRNRGSVSNSADIRLNDFANSDVAANKTRLKKSTSTNMIVKVVNQQQNTAEALTSTALETKDWFDLSLDECNFDSGNDEEKEEQENSGEYKCTTSTRTRRKKPNKTLTTLKDKEEEEDKGKFYPIDIWFLIGAYIRPEDVRTFSSICKSAYAVTQTSKFWTRLYKRYYKPLECLPVRLEPGVCLERVCGLRACVIRSLYYFYPPFQEKIKNRSEADTHSLLKRQCDTLWHTKSPGMFHYYFKLKEQNNDDILRYKTRQPDLMEMLTDMDVNTEKSYRVLQLTSRTFTALPPTILGQTLLSISSNLSSDLRSDNVRLIFGPPHAIHCSKQKLGLSNIPENATAVSINHVIRTKILEWWSPSYPHHVEARHPVSSSNSRTQQAPSARLNPPEDIFF